MANGFVTATQQALGQPLGTTITAPVAATSAPVPAAATQSVPLDGTIGADSKGNLYTYSSAAGGFVSNTDGKTVLTPSQGVAPIPNGYQTTGPLGGSLTYDAKTNTFSTTPGSPVNPLLGPTTNPIPASSVTGSSQTKSGTAAQALEDLANRATGGITGSLLNGLGGLGAGGIDTSAIAQAAATSGATGANFLNQAQNYQGGTAMQLTPAQAQAALAAQGNPVIAGGYAGATVAPAALAQAALAAQQAPIQAGTFGGANIGPAALAATQPGIGAQQLTAAQANGVTLGPVATAGTTTLNPAATATGTQLSPAAQAEAAQLNLANANQTRGQQEGLINSLQGTIAGTTPSVAAIMLKQQTEQNIANQWAQAQAASGMNTGLAERQAMIGSAQANQQAIGQQALLRAQEIATAQGQLGTNLGAVSGQDVGVASTQAQLAQQTALANQAATNTGAQAQLSADVQTKLANAGFINTQSMTQAQLNQAIALANAGFKNTASTTQAQLDQATQQLNVQQANTVGQANQSANLAAQTTNAGLANQVALANAASQNAQSQAQGQLTNAAGINNANNTTSANTSSAQLANQVALANAAAQTGTSQANAAAQNTAAAQQANLTSAAGINNANNLTAANTTSAQLANQVALANAAAQTGVSTSNAAQANAVGQSNQTAALNQQNINNTAVNNLNTAGVTSQGQAITGTVGAAQAQAQAEAAKAAELGAVATAGASLLTKSDRRAKTDIAPAGSSIMSLLDDIKAGKWEYKNPSEPGASQGTNYGVMAQDLEKNPVGRSLVVNTPTGKMVDPSKAAMVALAAVAELAKRKKAA